MIGRIKKVIFKLFQNQLFPGSKDYWEKRYSKKGNSGPGSYNRLATFKAEVLNDFLAKNNIQSVMEFGCGDGNQLTLAKYPSYLGIDVSTTAISLCKELFTEDSTKEFFTYTDTEFRSKKVDLTLSLDVIYHLIEDAVFNAHMSDLFNHSSAYVIIYSSNFDKKQTFHERDRKFSNWIDQHQPEWKLVETVKNKFPFDPTDPDNTSKADFFIYKKS
ncbi:methyltransferase domain-containing protein [Spongiivirga citrea]|uniref:Methyltransferase domain-containing protein n=1 Tax=Spongiivirga citrea TaxID=1481457 RepID=A0A6M0CKW5_9FLAO|nr:class I SAM-dependent methyltransferase [Spongiivirga citrea]NER18282.1 methyltransferase domain-containing protein [Spongiivirga citrea]